MIISRTPLRVSFVGGGTDLPGFCNKERGAVVSTTIQKYVYVVVHPSFNKKNKIAYSKIEVSDNLDNIQNLRVKEAMKMTGITKGVEIHSIAEVPAGTGMGSSSSFTVGLLNALYAYQGKQVSAERLAKEAAEIEIKMLKEPIGKQDHYASAFGGFNKIEFLGEDVKVKPLILRKDEKEKLEKNLMMFYLGGTRDASSILSNQTKNLENGDIFNIHIKMRNLADEMEKEIMENNTLNFGTFLNKNWLLKKQVAPGVSNESIDKIYEKAMSAGASGGKVLGAGGEGFILFYVNPEKQRVVREALHNLDLVEFKFDNQGSRIIYIGD